MESKKSSKSKLTHFSALVLMAAGALSMAPHAEAFGGFSSFSSHAMTAPAMHVMAAAQAGSVASGAGIMKASASSSSQNANQDAAPPAEKSPSGRESLLFAAGEIALAALMFGGGAAAISLIQRKKDRAAEPLPEPPIEASPGRLTFAAGEVSFAELMSGDGAGAERMPDPHAELPIEDDPVGLKRRLAQKRKQRAAPALSSGYKMG